MSLVEEIAARLATASPEQRRKLVKMAESTRSLVWVPNAGPQMAAYNCQADELFYGGEAGGGKSDLAIGLALTAHKRSLILRRINKDALKLVPRIEQILGHRNGYNGQLQTWRLGDRQIDIAGCEQEIDKQRFKGDPHDLIIFDEGTDFLESQFRFIIGWNRSSDPKQRCRVIVPSNPPTTAEGLWVIKYWAPWLDPTHPNPAKEGELRWFTTIAGEDREVDGPGPHMIDGEPIMARSRTFIRSSLADNPDLSRTNYGSVLAALPDELRRAYRDGDFGVSLKDGDWQVVPTKWVVAAQERWKPDGYRGLAMTAQGLDIGAGRDETVLASRFGAWFAPLETIKGDAAKELAHAAGMVVLNRRNNCPVVIDVGGGFGGASLLLFKENGIAYQEFNGAGASHARTLDGKLQFVNKRAEAWWKMREALNPDQLGGSAVALPPDPQLRADMTAPTWKLTPRGIQIESKEDIKKRLGRSPDRGDACVMCLSEGERAAAREARRSGGGSNPQPILGHSNMKRYARR
jgi:hypothetical protein